MSLTLDMVQAVRDRFDATMVAAGVKTVQHDNVPVPALPPSDEYWCRFTVLLGRQEQANIAPNGSRLFRTTGVALAQLFAPQNAGDRDQLLQVSAIQDAFRGVTLAGPPYITFRPPFVSAGPVRDGAFVLRVVTIEFQADEFA